MDDKERHKTDDEAEAGDAASANPLWVGLVLVGAAALVVSMFLPFAQPAGGVPIVGNNNLYEQIGWKGFFIPFFLALSGYQAGQGKRSARWSLIFVCAIAAIGIVLLVNAKGLRTLYPVGAGGAVDTSQPGLVTDLGIAIYVAGAGVAVAFLGALGLFQSAGKEVANVGSTRQRQTRVAPGPERNPEAEQAVLEAEASGAEVETHAVEAPTRAIRSRLESMWPLIAAIVVVVATAAGYLLLGRPSTTSQSSISSQPPTKLTAEQVALERFLLSPDQINTAMGTSGLTVGGTTGAMVDVASKVSDEACLPIATPAGAKVYEGSGWSTMVGQEIREPGNFFRHGLDQFVVSFPSAQEAGAFFTASTQSWQACANGEYTMSMMGQNMVHTVGPVSNADGTLSVTHTQRHGNGTYACQRALTVANNVVIDVAACSLNLSDAPSDAPSDAAVNIAHQIAAKVPVGNNNNPAPSTAPETSITAGPAPAPPVAEGALDGLLLNLDQVNTAMGAAGMTITKTVTAMGDASANVADKACLPLDAPEQAAAYADSGWTAVRGQNLQEPGDPHAHLVGQAVVLFSSAHDAGAFFTASAQRWPACRQFTHTMAGQPDVYDTVGPVSNTNGILSATLTHAGSAWTCQRALTVANNVAIDVTACSHTQSDSAVNIAAQIAAKVPT
jgi:PknH-like extracellular domain